MCATCGCSDDGGARLTELRPASEPGHRRDAHTDAHPHAHGEHEHTHPHGEHEHTHPHGEHEHTHPHGGTETVTLEARVLAKNDDLAAANRDWLRARGVVAVNLMSSPGSGKTTLLERTVRMLAGSTPLCVIEGDQETTFDAERIQAAGAPVLQINTGSGCHLDAVMTRSALDALDPRAGVVLIENVGNLVCPALFDLGEAARVVIMSVTEGADKPLKYPHIFASATVVVLNKVDLLPYVDFDLDRFRHDVSLVNPDAEILPVSATRGDGLPEWLTWLDRCVAGAAPPAAVGQAR